GAARAALPAQPHVVPRDRGAAAPVHQHRQDAGPGRLPQARRVLPLGRRGARAGRRADRPVIALTVWRFDTPAAAGEALPRLEQLVAAGDARIDDAALVSWPRGRRKPSTRDIGSLTGPGNLWGGFWGVLLALIFLTPLAGPAFGAAAGAVAGSLTDF